MNPAQPSLFDLPRWHRKDPETAKAAAYRAADKAITHRKTILAALESRGQTGATHDELDRELGWRPGTANRRCCELRQAGELVRTKRRRPTRTGSLARVYVLPHYRTPGEEID